MDMAWMVEMRGVSKPRSWEVQHKPNKPNAATGFEMTWMFQEYVKTFKERQTGRKILAFVTSEKTVEAGA